MKNYATTYPALINQAIELGRPADDLARLRQTHDFAERAADGVYRAQSAPLICHFVRSASILLEESQPILAVQAAMIHGIYRNATFRDSRRYRVNPRQRAMVQRTLGHDVEALVWTYDQLPWYRLESVKQHLDQIDQYNTQKRMAVIVRLADYLDDHLDRAMVYAGRVYDDDNARAYCETSCAIARKLGCPGMADDILAAYEDNFSTELPDSVVMHRTRGYERSRRHLWERPLYQTLPLDLARRLYRRLTRQKIQAALTYGGNACDCESPETQQ